MNRTKIIIALFVSLVAISCKKYLDIVPDNTLKLENIFNTRENAWEALAKVYSYMPQDDKVHLTSWTLGDEWVGRLDLNNNTGDLRAMRIMRGLQTESDPQLGLWSGTQGGKKLYEAIRQADVFLTNIDQVKDMTETELKDWKAQVKMLKAHYMFLLIERYGPIVIPTVTASAESEKEELFIPRSKVEDCFNYVINLMNEAIPDLKEKANATELGQIDQVVAKAIKAKILFYRASPFFNGNQEYFGDFLDHDGQPFFPYNMTKKNGKPLLMLLTKR
ncbi:RagB/SusD family nutrient uptake outer membrane protein [Niabella ginsengisoli]|uniref:RagB/SusD family nutrient uptake outer membrane protein n=1 Tax=Niabella ginsengisoli TaxID=522298 RepID=A0ABS9SJV1_9BACT|nr:RagB/SusD family nutrient uptake outer membrane protein [Niabella ginsengisoli]MCH5598600.1 RagB/SusD family nutrient uptake outer membrane protein [Niabella ginsengisoli]